MIQFRSSCTTYLSLGKGVDLTYVRRIESSAVHWDILDCVVIYPDPFGLPGDLIAEKLWINLKLEILLSR